MSQGANKITITRKLRTLEPPPALLRAPRGQLPEEQPALDYGRLLSGARVRRQGGGVGPEEPRAGSNDNCELLIARGRRRGCVGTTGGVQAPAGETSGWSQPRCGLRTCTRLPRPSVPESAAPCSGHAPTNLMVFHARRGRPPRGGGRPQRRNVNEYRPTREGGRIKKGQPVFRATAHRPRR